MHIKTWESQFLILLWPMVLMWAEQAQKIYLMLAVKSEMLTHSNKSYKVLTTKNGISLTYSQNQEWSGKPKTHVILSSTLFSCGQLYGKPNSQDVTWGALPQFSSVAQSCLTLFDPMDCSTPGLPVHHQLPELAQTHVHWVGDDIQPSHPLSSPFPSAFSFSQHQGLF